MAIEDRNLAVGVKLAAKYKKQVFTCEVVQTEEGVRYRLAASLPAWSSGKPPPI